jgi:alcohol dehydrogenase
MPYVLVWNRAALEEKMAHLGRVLGLEPRFSAVLDWILELRATLQIPATLQALGVAEERIDTLAACALQDPSTAGNPLPLTAADFAALYRNCLHGQL